MMEALEQITTELFSSSGVRILNFGIAQPKHEPENQLIEVLPSIKVQRAQEMGAETHFEQKIAARGLHPIMLVKFDYVFTKTLTGEDLFYALLGFSEPIAYRYSLAYTSLQEIQTIVGKLAPFDEITQGHMITDEERDLTELYYQIKAGTTFFRMYFNKNPLPDNLPSC